MAVLGSWPSVLSPIPPPAHTSSHRFLYFSPSVLRRRQSLSGKDKLLSISSNSTRIESSQHDGAESSDSAKSDITPKDQNGDTNIDIGGLENKPTANGSSFLPKLGILLGVAVMITMISVSRKTPSEGTSFGVQYLLDGSSSSSSAATTGAFSFRAFGYKVVLPEYPPGWIYFWLLMAAGFGLFISEEALNIWVI